MANTTVRQHSRRLKNGETVSVTQHSRGYEPATVDNAGRTPVQQLRRERTRRNARIRREHALKRLKESSARGWKATKKRARQSALLGMSGAHHIRRGFTMIGRRRRAAAVCLMGAGVAEIGAAVAWQGIGVTITTLSILGATLGGALLIGRHGRHSKTGQQQRARAEQKTTRAHRQAATDADQQRRARDAERKKRAAISRNRQRMNGSATRRRS
jgi:hypothetical protein